MKKHNYHWIVDDVWFKGQYTIEEDDPGYLPIITICTLEAGGIDLLLVIDPRIIHEIEQKLLEEYQWNE